MNRKYLGVAIVVLAALTLLAGTAPSSTATAVELKGNQKKQRLLVPAVQMVREKAARSTQRRTVRGSRTITVGGSRTE
jgi:hypothetical protein